jgi:hypothetical protein
MQQDAEITIKVQDIIVHEFVLYLYVGNLDYYLSALRKSHLIIKSIP